MSRRVSFGLAMAAVAAMTVAGLWSVPGRAGVAGTVGAAEGPEAGKRSKAGGKADRKGRRERDAAAKAPKAKKAGSRTARAADRPVEPVSMGTPQSLRMAILDLGRTFGDKYYAAKYLGLLDEIEGRIRLGHDAEQVAQAFAALQREALLANPLLDFDRILLVKRPLRNARTEAGGSLGLPTLNARVNDTIKDPGTGWDDTLEELSELRGTRELRTVYKTDQRRLVCDVDLHFDGERIMFSSGDTADRWGLYEYKAGDSSARLLSPGDVPDVSFYDSCYLPNGKIATTSTASYQGLPCQNGNQPMASMYLLDPETKKVRQLTFEQDSDWCPTETPHPRPTDAPSRGIKFPISGNPGQFACGVSIRRLTRRHRTSQDPR